MKIFERFLISRIDRALDDGQPLTGLTRQFVLRNERLRSYYESMLALELDLRFADDEQVPALPSCRRFSDHRALPSPRHRWITVIAAVAVCFLVAVGLFLRETPKIPPNGAGNSPEIAQIPPKDDDFRETLAAFLPSPEEAIIDFSERPLELTATILAHVGSFVVKHSPTETMDTQGPIAQ